MSLQDFDTYFEYSKSNVNLIKYNVFEVLLNLK